MFENIPIMAVMAYALEVQTAITNLDVELEVQTAGMVALEDEDPAVQVFYLYEYGKAMHPVHGEERAA